MIKPNVHFKEYYYPFKKKFRHVDEIIMIIAEILLFPRIVKTLFEFFASLEIRKSTNCELLIFNSENLTNN